MQANVDGLYRAIVTNNMDPLGSSRIKTICPQISGTAELNWAEPENLSDPIPNTGDQVWIFFNGGETYKPVYLITKTPFTWHTPTFNTGWANGTGIGGNYPQLRWRYTFDDAVWVHGTFHATQTGPPRHIASGFPLPNIYQGQGNVSVGGAAFYVNGSNVSMPLFITTAGELWCSSNDPTSFSDPSATFIMNIKFPLGNLA